MKNFFRIFFKKVIVKIIRVALWEMTNFFWKIFLKGHEGKTEGWPLEKHEIFWKILYGEPWALSNTPFYGGG